jgi:hypothetical protein
LAPGATTTLFSPVELGGTGKSFTDTIRAPSTFLYPAGTAIGAPSTVIFEGLQRTSGPGDPRLVGREVYEGVIIGYTPDGVPIVDTVALISQAGSLTWARSCRRVARGSTSATGVHMPLDYF